SLGKAKDIAFGLDGSVALIVMGNDNSEIQITMDRIVGVADYIVVRRDRPEPKAEMPQKRAPAPMAAAAAPVVAPVQARVNPAIPAAPVAVPVAAAPVCKNCGAPLRVGAKFCTKCGTAQ
ncbi:MAG: zinc ribbon domain-containing protein, partial [Thaumarchaeota archaeon]|nr:zinc ribbon domain-containing protein [Nitrososphaerota archaeon]